MKRLASLLLLAMTSVASAEVNSSDVAAALEARYGPLEPNTSISITVNSVGPYSGRKTAAEADLPEKFITVIWDQQSKRFAALVEDETGSPVRIAGVATLEHTIPVLKTKLNVGDIISEADIEHISVSSAASTQNIVFSDEDIIGKEVARHISPGRPIVADYLSSPTVVKRNEMVQLIFKKGGLELISKGRSLSNAAVGDTVKIVRKDAARTLEGIAVSEGVVAINSGALN